MIMETTQTLRFKTKALAVLSKCYDHAQTHLKGGVLQLLRFLGINSPAGHQLREPRH